MGISVYLKPFRLLHEQNPSLGKLSPEDQISFTEIQQTVSPGDAPHGDIPHGDEYFGVDGSHGSSW